jgi:two-component system phosphate regulon response regulator PhoB
MASLPEDLSNLRMRLIPVVPIVTSDVVISSLDADFCFSVRHILEGEGFTTELAMGPAETIAAVKGRATIGLLLDGRPDFALSLCRALKDDGATRQVRIVTLVAAEEAHRFSAFLEAGVDEAFLRPVEPDRYLRALERLISVRRSTSTGHRELQPLRHAGLTVDTRAHRVLYDGHVIRLGPVEFGLLRLMTSEPVRAFRREELASGAWPQGVFVDPRTVNVHIGRLRRALKPVMRFDIIRTVRGIGYGLETDEL